MNCSNTGTCKRMRIDDLISILKSILFKVYFLQQKVSSFLGFGVEEFV